MPIPPSIDASSLGPRDPPRPGGPWARIPEDILRGVGSRLPADSRSAAAAVCRDWADVSLKWRKTVRCRGGVFRSSLAPGWARGHPEGGARPIDPLEDWSEVVLEDGDPAGAAVTLRRAAGGEARLAGAADLEGILCRVLGAAPCRAHWSAGRPGATGWVPVRVSLAATPSESAAAAMRDLSALVARSGLPRVGLILRVAPRSRTKNLWGRVGGPLGGFSGVACPGRRCSCAVARSLARRGSGADGLERVALHGVVGSLGSDLVAGLGPAAEDVALTDCQLEDRDLWRLAGLPALRALDVSNNPRLTFGGVVAFGISPNLTKLSLRWTKLQASALSALLLLPALEELDVSANLWVSEECGPLSSPRLESLNISSCFLEDDDAWEMLGPRANLPALERLDVSDNYLGGLSFARGLGALTSLDARGNLVDPAHARRTLRGLDKLSALDLRGNVS